MILVAIFQYVSAGKMSESKDRTIEQLQEQLASAESIKDSLTSEYNSLISFSLASNEDAISYFEDRGYDAFEVATLVEDQIIDRNSASGDNELVPYEGMEGFMRINKIRILNHRWLIASFTDGTYWGEVFITYFIDEDNNLHLEAENSLLYPRD